MALTQRLQLRQSQALVMTPQLMQAIKLLQLSNLDLVAYVEAELERNPLLDRTTNPDGEAAPGSAPGAQSPDKPVENGVAWEAADGEPLSAIEKERADKSLDDTSPDDSAPGRSRTDTPPGYSEWAGVGSGGRDGEDYNLEAFVSAETTLADWLREQLTLAIADPMRRMVGQYLIDLIDEAGYLTSDLATTAEKLGTSVAEVEAVLRIMQTFDPPGVGARDLAECLTIQLKEQNRYDPAMQALIARLDLLARRDFASLKKVCGVGDDDLVEMIAEIRRLNPKPGLAFGSAIVQPIVPDVFVRSGPSGSWIVELNSDTLPKVLVNQIYYAEVSATTRRDNEKILSQRMPAKRHVAGSRARSARPHHSQGFERNRSPAGRVSRSWRRASAPAQSQDRRRGHWHARIDGVPRHREQVHGDQPRHFRAQILFHLVNRGLPWRRSTLGRGSTAPH